MRFRTWAVLLLMSLVLSSCELLFPVTPPTGPTGPESTVFTLGAGWSLTVNSGTYPYGEVRVSGSFNNWAEWDGALVMTQQNDGSYRATIDLDSGTYLYKFQVKVADGTEGFYWVSTMDDFYYEGAWHISPVGQTVADGFGGFNMQFTVP